MINSKINLNDDIKINIIYDGDPDTVFFSIIYMYNYEIVAIRQFFYISFVIRIWDSFNNFYPAEEYHQDYKDKNPIRYNAYREGSGRNSYIRLHWQDGSTTTKAIFNENKLCVETNR